MSIYGYFTDATQDKPTFDPGLSVPCPFCDEIIMQPRGKEQPIQTIAFAMLGKDISYFYRAHKSCYESASPEKIQQVESIVDNEEQGMQ